MKNILVAYSSNSIAARELLIGVFNYVNSGHNWNLKLLEGASAITPTVVAEARKSGVDGILTGFQNATDGYKALVSSDIPVALSNSPPSCKPLVRENIVLLHNDEVAIGRQGAQYFLSHGQFRSFGFVPTPEKTWWSTYRQRGFRLELAKRHENPRTFRGAASELSTWLAALPKPAAVMAATDFLGVRTIEACHLAKIEIPEQVAVLGVDNDELVCNGVRPTLSSIHPNHVELARRACRELDRIISGKVHRNPKTILVSPLQTIERDSTRTVPPAGHLIRMALAFARENCGSGISAGDVARHLHVSPSLLRLRFKTVNGKSLRDEIIDMRLDAVRKQLANTSDSLTQIAAKSGIGSANRLSHLFKLRFGISPTAFRKHHLTRTSLT